MEDDRIVALYWERSETAIDETAQKYGSYCYAIAHGLLRVASDSEECVNDTYMAAWDCIPPHKPAKLSTFLGKLTRRLAVDRLRKQGTDKRGGGELPLVLDELSECVASSSTVETDIDRRLLIQALRTFIDTLSTAQRDVFFRRYWYAQSIEDIASAYRWSNEKVKSMLHRIRKKLQQHLQKEGFL